MNLYLDDCRLPTESSFFTKDHDYDKLEWVIATSYDEFVKIVIEYYDINGVLPNVISFDHDLADSHYETVSIIDYEKYEEKTGFHAAKWLTEFCMEKKIDLPTCKIHSMNSVGAENIRSYLNNFKKFQLSEKFS